MQGCTLLSLADRCARIAPTPAHVHLNDEFSPGVGMHQDRGSLEAALESFERLLSERGLRDRDFLRG